MSGELEYEIKALWIVDGERAPHCVYRVYDRTGGRWAKVAGDFDSHSRAVEWILDRRG